VLPFSNLRALSFSANSQKAQVPLRRGTSLLLRHGKFRRGAIEPAQGKGGKFSIEKSLLKHVSQLRFLAFIALYSALDVSFTSDFRRCIQFQEKFFGDVSSRSTCLSSKDF